MPKRNYVLIREEAQSVGLMERENIRAASTNRELVIGVAKDEIRHEHGWAYNWTLLVYNNATGVLIESIQIDSTAKVVA